MSSPLGPSRFLVAGCFVGLGLLAGGGVRAAGVSAPPTQVAEAAPMVAPPVGSQLAEALERVQAGQPWEGLQLAEKARDTARTLKDYPGEAEAERLRAQCLDMFGAVPYAVVEALEAAERLSESAGDGPGRIGAISRQTLIHADVPRKDALVERAIAIARHERRRPQSVIDELLRFSAVLAMRGDFPRASRVVEVAVQLQRAAQPGTLAVVTAAMVAGRIEQDYPQFERAEQFFREALAILEVQAPQSPEMVDTLHHLGVLSAVRADLTAADAYLARGLALAERVMPESRTAGVLQLNLGIVAFRADDAARAEPILTEAVARLRRLDPRGQAYTTALLVQAQIIGQRGRHAEAEGQIREAHRILGEFAPMSLEYSNAVMLLGELHAERGELDEAERRFRSALALRERLNPYSPAVPRALGTLGGLMLTRRRYDEAEALLARGWDLYLHSAGKMSLPQALEGHAMETQWLADQYIEALVARGKASAALVVAEQSRGNTLQYLLLRTRARPASLAEGPRRRLDAAMAARTAAEAELAALALELNRAERAKQPTADSVLAVLRSRYAAAARSFSEARASAEVVRQEAYGVQAAASTFATAARVQKSLRALPEGTLYLSIKSAGKTAVLLVGSKAGVEGYVLPQPTTTLIAQIRKFRRTLAATSGEAVVLGRELFRALFPPKARQRVLAARRLLISPEEWFWELPFAALVVSEPGALPKYLGQAKPLTITPALALATPERRPPAPSVSRSKPVVLAVGDPVFDAKQSAGAVTASATRALLLDGRTPPPLPGTRVDAQAVAKLYGSTAVLGTAATEPAIRKQLPAADIVHLATHGYLSERWALASGVLLSVPPRPETGGAPAGSGNDGVLQAWEIMTQLQLKAELVVLAACDTSLGQTVRGEGLVGLSHALQSVGARSVVASRWQVRDDATRVLMVQFHTGLRAGLSKDEALRQAMATVSSRLGWSHPYFWGAFVLTGDPGPLPFTWGSREAGK